MSKSSAIKKIDALDQIKVLCVDDEEISLMLIKTQIEKLGYIALTANSPEAALKILEKEAADIALVISDYKMPIMTGAELNNIVSVKWPDIPFALMSATIPVGIQTHL